MKSSFFSLFAVAGLFATSAIATPVAAPAAVEKRQADAAMTVVTNLLSTIQGYDATINSTIAPITSASTDDEKSAASTTVNAAVSNITSAINDAITQTQAIPTSSKRDLVARDTATATSITLVLEEILEELSNTLNGVISALGLNSLLGFLDPLTSALSKLIKALEVVVDDLLAVVEELLNGILGGLSLALSGLTL